MAASTRTARAAVLEGPGQMRMHSLPIPEIGPDEALLRIDLAGVCGTDTKYFTGTLTTPYPVILGHEICGTLETVGAEAAARYQVGPGDRVLVEGSIPCWSCGRCRSGEYRFCTRKRVYGSRTPMSEPPGLWGAMAEYMYIAPGSILHKIPEEIPAGIAICAALIANGIEWLRLRGGVSMGDRVVIQGCGPQGLAATVVAAESGARQIIVTGLARDTARLELARALGAHHTLTADTGNVVEQVADLTDGALADVVLDVSGSASALATSIEIARTLGTVVLAGLAGKDAETSFRPDQLVWKEIRLQGAYVKGEVAYSKALQFIATRGHRYPLDRIVSHVYPLDRAEEAIMAASGKGVEGLIKTAIRP